MNFDSFTEVLQNFRVIGAPKLLKRLVTHFACDFFKLTVFIFPKVKYVNVVETPSLDRAPVWVCVGLSPFTPKNYLSPDIYYSVPNVFWMSSSSCLKNASVPTSSVYWFNACIFRLKKIAIEILNNGLTIALERLFSLDQCFLRHPHKTTYVKVSQWAYYCTQL